MDFLRRTWAEINLDALDYNIGQIRAASCGKELIAVVKADAYGHCCDIVCRELFSIGIKTFAVSNIWEGEDLKKTLPAAEIIIFGYTEPAYFDSITKYGLIPAVGSLDYARQLDSFAKDAKTQIKIHIKVDTGMSRVGIDSEDELSEILSLENISAAALFTHFSVSDSEDEADRAFTRLQQRKLQIIAEKYALPLHSQNSGGILFHPDFGGSFIRAGLAVYGYSSGAPFKLKPVMSLKSSISQIKTIKKGAEVSYGRTYTAPCDIVAAVLPVGYADGYSRGLSNKGKVLIHGTLCPVLGRVCMDQIIVDASAAAEIKVGDTAEIYSDNSAETSIEYIAEMLGTIPYEITCSVGHRVPRVAVRDGKVVEVVRY